MNELVCPHCHTHFTIDQSHYAELLSQVRDQAFEKDIARRAEALEAHYTQEMHLTQERTARTFEQQLTEQRETIAKLEQQAQALNFDKEQALRDAKHQHQQELRALENQLTQLQEQMKTTAQQVRYELDAQHTQALHDKDLALQQLKQATQEQVYHLQTQLTVLERDSEAKAQALQKTYEIKLQEKDEQITSLRDFKVRLSTKMLGESLEQHCETEFNRLRMTAFPKAQFGKDNDITTGSKGDYIFREYDEEGTELLSIMFEMKNESDATATKKRNEHFFKELDKDRREKQCEYAILVSMLETDSELYNTGIVDVSYHYEKMYVVRPQFFIQIITLLRNAALNAAQYKRQISAMKQQHTDITHFEDDLNAFKQSFARNYELASKKFKTAIDEIDKTITHLQKTKDALLSSENNLRIANNKADDLTIKKLVRNNPTMKQRFDDLNKP